jgi:hypothetical protein
LILLGFEIAPVIARRGIGDLDSEHVAQKVVARRFVFPSAI